MDPFTIATTALTILQGIKRVSGFLDAACKVHEVLGDLKRELDSLCGDIDNVNNICQDPDFVPAATAYRDSSQSRIFTQLQANLKSCIDTIDKLNDTIAYVDRGGNGKLINKGLTQVRLEDRAGDCIQIRQRIHTHRGSLQLSLTALQFCMQMQSMKKEERAGKLINIKMNKLTTIVENQSAEIHRLRDRFRSTQKRGHQVSDEDTQMLQDMEDIHESTLYLKRMAIAVAERKTPIKDQQHPAMEAVQAGAVSAKHQSQVPDPRPTLQHIVSAPEQAMHSVQGTASPFMPQRIMSNPQLPPTPALSGGGAEVSQPNRAGTPVFHKRRSDRYSHSSSHTAQESQMEDFDDAMSSAIANAQREKQHPSKPFKEKHFQVISHLLSQVGKPRWSERPRTYLVLRLINEVQAMDGFVLEGLKDLQFPYTEERLPACIASPGSRYAFLEKQALVMSNRAADLVCRGPHRHLSMTADTHFTIIGYLGKGGQGTVDLVKSPLSIQTYARKRLYRTRTFIKNKHTLATFEKEIHNLKRLDHIHLVKLVGSYTDPKYVGLIMDPVADIDLKKYLMLGSFSVEQLTHLKGFFGCLSSAVKYLHANQCRHKDIKPGNILVKDGTVLITDFGTSLDWTELEADATNGRPMAFTNTYAAPEVAQAKSRNSSADLWSLGCVFIEMITVLKGQTPEDRRLFFKQNGTGSPCFHDNQEALRGWIDVLSAKTSEHEQPLTWIKQMTVENPSARIEARDLFDQILSFGKFGEYYGQCCSDHTGSEEDSWQGSESDEEDGNVRNNHTKCNIPSPAVTWPPATRNKSLQNPDQICEDSPSGSPSEPIKFELPRLPWQDATAKARMYEPTGKPESPIIDGQQGPSRATSASSAAGVRVGTPLLHHQSGRDRHEGALHATCGNFTRAKTIAPSDPFMTAKKLEELVGDNMRGDGSDGESRQEFAQILNAAKTPVLGSATVGVRATESLQDPEFRPFSVNDPVLRINDKGQTVLHRAVTKRQASVVSDLLRHSGRSLIDVKDKAGQTSLHLASTIGCLNIVSILLDHGAAIDPTDKAGRTPGMISHIDVFEEISTLLDQARNSKVSNAVSVLPVTSSPPMAQSTVSDSLRPPQDVSSPLTDPCDCEVCKLRELSAQLEEPTSEDIAKCMCSGCLERLAAATISDFELVRATLDSCNCEACLESRGKNCDQCQNEEHAPPEDDEHKPYDTIDYTAIDAKYEAQLQHETNQPPCDYNGWTTERIAKCEQILSEGDFAKTPYYRNPDSALALLMDKYEAPTKFVDLACFLLKHGANIETKNKYHRTLLHLAALRGIIPLAVTVLNKGADPNALCKHTVNTLTPLLIAVIQGHADLVYLLLKKGSGVDDQPGYLRQTALHFAITPKFRNLEILKILLRYHPKLELVDRCTDTPLRLALLKQDTEIASILLRAGANTEEPDKNGNKPLAFAIQPRNLKMVQLLLNRGANVHCRCGTSPNALTYAAQTGCLCVLSEIIGKSTIKDIDACDSQGRTVLHLLAPSHHLKDDIPGILDLLIKSGASLDPKDDRGSTPLHVAVKARNLIMVLGLVEAGANKCARNRSGKTPFDLAVAKRDQEIVNILGGELKKKWYRRR